MKFKVGDRVEHEFYGKGTVIGVSSTDTPLVEFDNPFNCWFTSDIKPLNNQTIVIYSKGLETIALLKEGKKVIKQATAKCNPSDTYDFNIGAKLAFSRLVGGIYIGGIDMAIDTIREVKRPAKVGEWIKIVDADAWFDEYKNGDVFKVDELYTSREEGIITSPHHIAPREYVVLENYQPEAKPFFSQSTIDEISRYTDKELINELSRRWEDK